MFKRIGLSLSVGAMCLLAPVAWAGDDLPAVEKKIHEAWEKHKSLTAKVALATHMESGEFVMDGKGSGSLEVVKKGGKVFSRMELKQDVTQKMGEQESKVAQQLTVVIDGDFAYTVSEMLPQKDGEATGQKNAFKTKIEPDMTGEPKALFEQLHKENELKLLPDETTEGRKAYAIEATPKEKSGSPIAKQLLYFDQESGFLVKLVGQDAAGKPTTTMTYTDIKLNVDVNPDRFKKPEGVDFIDQTGEKPAAPAEKKEPADEKTQPLPDKKP